MTKRTLLIIIALLVIVDIVAGFWYLSARLEANGMGFDMFNMARDKAPATAADTVADTNLPNTFVVVERHAYFISTSAAIRGNEQTRFTSVKHVKVRWPQSVNGSDSFPDLDRELLAKAFGYEAPNLKVAMEQTLNKPTFNSANRLGYRTLGSAPPVHALYSNIHTILVYPLMTSSRLLELAVETKKYNGIETQTTMRYVHYDRGLHRVINHSDIFVSGSNLALLGMINGRIDALNQEKRLKISHAAQVPPEFSIHRKGIIFHFSSGQLSDAREGECEVFLDYSALQPVFTPSFKQLVRDNGGYWDYKRITL